MELTGNETIIGQRDETTLLVLTDPERELARVVQRGADEAVTIYPEQDVHAILKFGYWEAYDGPQDILPDLVDGVEPMPPPIAREDVEP